MDKLNFNLANKKMRVFAKLESNFLTCYICLHFRAMPKKNTQGLKHYKEIQKEDIRKRVLEAISQLLQSNKRVSFLAIEQIAKVSRTTLYSDPELREKIQALRSNHKPHKLSKTEMKLEALEKKLNILIVNVAEMAQTIKNRQ